MLVLDWGIIWTFLNVIILYILLKLFLFKPVNAMMEKRSQLIEQDLENAKTKSDEAQKLKVEYENIHAKADGEAMQILKDAKARGEVEYNKIIDSAQKDTSVLMENAKKSIDIEHEKMLQAVRQEIAGIALIAASKLAQKSIDESSNKQLIDELIEEVGVKK